ncbi:MAG TPA: hypothetical protein VFB04_18145 [Terriglobales bacterium]|nr:hypothetical protein [Terriglobales bacterium]
MSGAHLIAAAALLFAAASTSLLAQETATAGLAHTRTEFKFTVQAPFEQAAPLFGADEERKWSPEWDPQFLYPQPAHDEPGMVFKIRHGEHEAVWLNTAFDLAAGHFQYAYVLNGAMATLIDIHLAREGVQKTGVTVVYQRTALVPEANEHVQHFAKGDEKAGKEWEDAINGYLLKGNKK